MQESIYIKNVEFFGYHGVFDFERGEGQRFVFSARIFLDMDPAGKSDRLEDTVDYGELTGFLASFLRDHPFQLLEAAVTKAMEEVLLRFELLKGIELELQKPNAPIGEKFETVSVTRSMFWHTAYIGLGSNMGDSQAYINDAIRALEENPLCRELCASKLIRTAPYGGVEQDDYLNGVLRVRTLMTPQGLLSFLQELEQKAGRERSVHWGPRTLDLDILFYDDLVINTERLCVPHPDLQNRLFVLEPLEEIAPHFRHPLLKKTARQMIDNLC